MSTGPPVSSNRVQRLLPRILFGAVLLPILLFLGWFVHWRWSNAAAIRRLEAKARKNHEPLTWRELAAIYPPIADKENGAALIMDAWEKDDPLPWRLFRDGAEHIPTPKSPDIDPALPYRGMDAPAIRRTNDVGAVNLRAADAYLGQRKQHLDQIRGALRHSQFWFPVRISSGSMMLLPHLAEIKGEALDFSLDALVASERGDLDSAIAAIENTAHMGTALKSEPLTLSQSVRLACYRIALNDMQRLLSRRSLSVEQLNRLVKLLEELRTPGGLRLEVIEGRIRSLDLFASWDRVPGVKFVGRNQLEKRLMLDNCDRMISLGDADKPEVLRDYKLICTDALEAAKAISSEPSSEMLFQELPSVAHKFAMFESQRRAAITALAFERYRIEHDGKLPQQLSEIAPQYLKEIPTDPLDGKPLGLKRLPIGFVVGTDISDDGDYKRAFPEKTFTIER